jgi:hypothetical protein
MEPHRSRRPSPALWAALAALAATLAVASHELGSLGGDNAEYVLLARHLGRFDGYVSGWAPGPAAWHTLYPPLFPLLLAPVAWMAPESFLGCHVVVSLLAAGAVYLMVIHFQRRGLPPWAAAAAALVPALSYLWLQNAADVLSDLPFLFFAAATLVLLEPGTEERLAPRRIVLGAVAAGLAFYTRTAGLALVLPVAVALSVDRRTRGRTGWYAAGVLLAGCALWFLYGEIAGSGSGYAAQLASGGGEAAGLFERAWTGLRGMYLPGTPAFVFPRSWRPWGIPLSTVAGLTLWGLAAVSLFEGFRRRRTLAVTEAFLLCYLAMQSAWPFSDPRFAIPLAALVVPLAVEEIHRIALWLKAPAAKIALAAAVLLLLPNAWNFATWVLPRSHRERPAAAPGDHDPASFAQSWAWNDAQFREGGVSLASFLHACDLVRANDVPGAGPLPVGPILVTNPRVAALLCGRPAVQAPAVDEGPLPSHGRSRIVVFDPTPAAEIVRREGVALVLRDWFDSRYSEGLREYTDANRSSLDSLLRLPGGVELLRVKKGPPGEGR